MFKMYALYRNPVKCFSGDIFKPTKEMKHKKLH